MPVALFIDIYAKIVLHFKLAITKTDGWSWKMPRTIFPGMHWKGLISQWPAFFLDLKRCYICELQTAITKASSILNWSLYLTGTNHRQSKWHSACDHALLQRVSDWLTEKWESKRLYCLRHIINLYFCLCIC